MQYTLTWHFCDKDVVYLFIQLTQLWIENYDYLYDVTFHIYMQHAGLYKVQVHIVCVKDQC